ncbi:MAG: PCRF domain-containing protein [Phycisphaerales bacterium]
MPAGPDSTSTAPPGVAPAAWQKLIGLEADERAIGAMLEDPDVVSDHRRVRELSIRRTTLEPIATSVRELSRLQAELTELREVAAGADAELARMARDEIPALESKSAQLLAGTLAGLVNSEDNRVGSVILEVRAGTGGDEAALWARDLLEMYQKAAAKRGWSVEVLDLATEAGAGGIRSATLNVRGPGVWTALNFEAGVHSVKRVPATEAQGRIHTSTATVAVLPEPEEVDIKIDWAKDVIENVTTSQGPGGQNVNKVATAVQLHHKPSGIVIRMQVSKSQQQNRELAKRLLMTKLHELERQKKHAERSAARTAQIGGGDRSEKIRTYRYKEGIVADERLPGEYQLRDLLNGDMNELHTALVEQQTQQRLAQL